MNTVSPGTVQTRWHLDRLGEDGFAEMARQERERVPLRRTARPEHVAQAVLALLAADLVTGETLVVDGGKAPALLSAAPAVLRRRPGCPWRR